ncbi:MAG TPA: NepR family anti-sigma factor [Xanthobacteraceae bacterium]|jgi:predicted RNA polymerase sigma factor
MSGSRDSLPRDRKAWLLAIGRRLRADYDALREPVPERLSALIRKLEQPPMADPAESKKANRPE